MVRNLAILRKINLSVQSEKSPFRQFDFWGKRNFPTRKRPHKAYFTKIIYLAVQINLDVKEHKVWLLVTDGLIIL